MNIEINIEKIREVFEKVYDSTMTVYIYEDHVDGPFTRKGWTTQLENEPCRISKKSLSPSSEGEDPQADYQIVLYCKPEVDIDAGSRIEITDPHGNVRNYKRSSEGFNSYLTHQEVVIVREVTP